MTYSHRIGVILAGALAMSACGGGGSIDFSDLGDELISAQCARLVRCGVYTSTEACKGDGTVDLSEIEHEIAAGRVAYDGEAASDCLDGLGSAACDSTTESARVQPKACDTAIHGTVADGGACFNSQECVSRDCSVPDCGLACCEGTCGVTIAEVAIGASCANAFCADGAFCNDADVCEALLVTGAACQSDSQCGYGLACGNNVCASGANRGEACLDGGCADIGDRCDGANCVALSGNGGSCTSGFAGLFDCQRPLVCNQTNLKCEAPPTIGQACQFFCAAGGFCNDQNVCEAPRANGGMCTSNGDCASDFCDESGANPVCAVSPVCG